jgi:hypothetical protein
MDARLERACPKSSSSVCARNAMSAVCTREELAQEARFDTNNHPALQGGMIDLRVGQDFSCMILATLGTPFAFRMKTM